MVIFDHVEGIRGPARALCHLHADHAVGNSTGFTPQLFRNGVCKLNEQCGFLHAEGGLLRHCDNEGGQGPNHYKVPCGLQADLLKDITSYSSFFVMILAMMISEWGIIYTNQVSGKYLCEQVSYSGDAFRSLFHQS